MGGFERLVGVKQPELKALIPKILMARACLCPSSYSVPNKLTIVLYVTVYQEEVLEEEYALDWGKHVRFVGGCSFAMVHIQES